MPLIDYFMMIGLSMDGTSSPSSEDFDTDLVVRYSWPQPVVYYKGIKGVLPSWFEKDYVWATNDSTPAEKAYSTWVFLLYLLTRSIFYRKSNRVYFYLLPALENLDLVTTQSWVGLPSGGYTSL